MITLGGGHTYAYQHHRQKQFQEKVAYQKVPGSKEKKVHA